MKKKTSILYIISIILLLIYFLVLIIPLIWGLYVSFIPSNIWFKYKENPLNFSIKIDLTNYKHAFDNFEVLSGTGTTYYGLGRVLLNTILYAGGCALMQTITPFIVSYLVARYDFKFSKLSML